MNKELNYSYDVLYKIYVKGSYLSVELNDVLYNADENVNKGLITKIVYGVCEHDIALTYMIKQFVSKLPSVETLLALKIGTYVGKFLNSIPKYTIVNELVEIVKRFDKNVSGFVNATLKNILNGNIVFPNKEKDLEEYLSVKYSYPKWLLKTLFKYYDKDTVLKIISSKITEMTHIRINKEAISIEEFKELLIKNNVKYQNSELDFCLYVDYEKLLNFKSFSKYYVVQGLPSVITALNAVNDRSYNILDLCSAPGGKSVLMASLNPNQKVTACDLHAHRLELVKSYAKKYNIKNMTFENNDATKLNKKFIDGFDSVLLDVPCSGSGVIVKKPDILLNRTEENIDELISIQKQILEVSSNYVKVGGILTYSTCSILPCENEDIIKDFLAKHQNFSLVPVNTYGIDVIDKEYGVTFFPYVSKTEGFFIGRLIKNGD